MNQLMAFHFIRPGWLVGLLVVPTIWWLWIRIQDPLRGWRLQMDPHLLKALTTRPSRRFFGQAPLVLAAWILTALALAGPTWRMEPSPFAAETPPIMILLKADESMEQGPSSPSKMERARMKIHDLAGAWKGQPLGLIAYAGSSHLVLPPTKDTAVVAEMANEIQPDVMPQTGDRLDLALVQAAKLLDEYGNGGTLLVIADSVTQDLSSVTSLASELPKAPVRFWSLAPPQSLELTSMEKAAQTLGGELIPVTVGDADTEAIVAVAGRQLSGTQEGDQGRWQEAGYWLLPWIALLVAFSFRKEASQ